MSGARMYTPGEIVHILRDAFCAGAEHGRDPGRSTHEIRRWDREEAERRYRTHTFTRRRVVEDEYGFPWSATDEGKLIATKLDGSRVHCSAVHATEARIRLWADLLANPTEEVEDVA